MNILNNKKKFIYCVQKITHFWEMRKKIHQTNGIFFNFVNYFWAAIAFVRLGASKHPATPLKMINISRLIINMFFLRATLNFFKPENYYW